MEAIVFIGVQGAGKSSYYREHFFHSHVRISLDLLHTRHRERLFLEACLKTQQRFVVDNTNSKRHDRATYIAAAHAARYEVVGYYFEVDLETALARNSSRPAFQVVPAKGVAGTFRNLEPPKLDEGFRRLYSLRLNESGQWFVASVEEAPGPPLPTFPTASPPSDQSATSRPSDSTSPAHQAAESTPALPE